MCVSFCCCRYLLLLLSSSLFYTGCIQVAGKGTSPSVIPAFFAIFLKSYVRNSAKSALGI